MRPSLLKFLLFLVGFIVLERLCHRATEGFQLQKIFSEIPSDLQWTTNSLETHLEPIFDQPYYFLGSGGQCYAFISEDKRYVIKFFKQHHMRKLSWLENISLPSFMDKIRNKILADRAKRSRERIFGSYKIANSHLKEETALLYLHLTNTTFFQKKLKIIDKLGIAHEIDLDTTEFALQQYANLAFPYLKKLIKEKKLDEVRDCFDSLLHLLVKRTGLGIIDHDPVFRKNFGFIGNQAIEIDLGSFSWQTPDSNLNENYNVLLLEVIVLKKWLAKRCPELLDYFNEQIDKTLPSY